MARIIEPPRGSDSYELRLSSIMAPNYRYIYGYVGAMKRIEGSANTVTPIMAQIVTKIGWEETDNGVKYARSAFARVIGYSANFADRYCGADFNISIRDLAHGYISVPCNTKHTGVNMHFWRFADLGEWDAFFPFHDAPTS